MTWYKTPPDFIHQRQKHVNKANIMKQKQSKTITQ